MNLRKKTKATDVFEKLRKDILEGELAPGERLQLDQLKDRYGVGYSPLREALCRLSANGLVQSQEQCGFSVANLSLVELHDLYNIRTHIENLALELSITQGDSLWEAEVLSTWHHYKTYLQSSKLEPKKWGELQKNFRTSLVKGCNSAWLLKIRDLLHEQAARYRGLCLTSHFNNKKIIKSFLQENENLVSAVIARNVTKALKLSQKTWDDSVKMIAEILKEKINKIE